MLSMIHKKSSREQITAAIREKIYCGDFSPKEELVQDTLANQFGVSRMPVREALLSLHAEGLVDYIPNRGFFVKKISDDFFIDYFLVRNIFEAEIIHRICTSNKDLAHYNELLTAVIQSSADCDLHRLSTYADTLHEYMAADCGSPRIAAYMRQMWNASPRRIARENAAQSDLIQESYSFYKEFLECIILRDAQRATELAKRYNDTYLRRHLELRNSAHSQEKPSV